METLRKNQEEMLQIKNTVKEMKNSLDGLISRLDTTKDRISELDNMSVEMFQTEVQEEKE